MLCIIQARSSSKRLPNKVLMEINGKKIIQHVIDQVLNIINISNLIVATSNNKDDVKVYNYCKKNSINCIKGSLNDVSKRFIKVLEKYKHDSFIRINGDSPLTDPKIIAKAIRIFNDGNYDIVTNVFPRSYPKGMSVEIIKKKILIDNYSKFDSLEKEHVTSHFYKKYKKFNIKNFSLKKNYSNINLSIDTRDDFYRIKKIINLLGYKNKKILLKDILKLNKKTNFINKSIINAGVIGLGVGKRHLDTYLSNNKINTVSVCDFNKRKYKDITSSKKNIKFENSADDLIKDKDINILSIASYDNYHAQQIIKALNYKKNIFIEKPICTNEKELTQIKKVLKRNFQNNISCNFVLRENPYFKYYKKIINNHIIGTIYHIEGEYNYGRLEKITSGWRGKITDYSVVNGGGVHIIDLFLWYINSKIETVYAIGNNISTKSKKNIKFDDNIVSIFKFKNNVTGKITSNFSSQTPHHHTISIYGTKGSIIHNKEISILYLKNKNGISKKIINFKVNKNYKEKILNNFINVVVNKVESIISKNQILQVMSIALAITKSNKSKKIERVKYD